MRTIILYPLIILISFIFSCKEIPTDTNLPTKLAGTWVYHTSNNDTLTYFKAAELDSEKLGYIFFIDGKLIERNYAGWCITPPVYLTNYEGRWEYLDESTIKITVDSWLGISNYTLNILTISDTQLKFIKRKQHEQTQMCKNM